MKKIILLSVVAGMAVFTGCAVKPQVKLTCPEHTVMEKDGKHCLASVPIKGVVVEKIGDKILVSDERGRRVVVTDSDNKLQIGDEVNLKLYEEPVAVKVKGK